jgi:hypothetical protein
MDHICAGTTSAPGPAGIGTGTNPHLRCVVQKAAAAAADDDGGDDDGDDLEDEDFDPNVSGGVPATRTVLRGSGTVTMPVSIYVPPPRGGGYQEELPSSGSPRSRSCRPSRKSRFVSDGSACVCGAYGSHECLRCTAVCVVQEDPAIREARLQYDPTAPHCGSQPHARVHAHNPLSHTHTHTHLPLPPFPIRTHARTYAYAHR